MNKTICLAVLAGMAILLASCAKVENPDLPETVGQGNIVTVTTTVSMAEGTRALDADGKKTFKAGDRLAMVYNDGESTVKVVSEPLAAGSYTNSATFTFYLVNPVAGSVTLHYPAAMVDSDGEVDYSALATQDGTLTSLGNTLDYATGTGTLSLSAPAPTLTASSALTNQLAIGAFTINGPGNNDITDTITGLTVSDGTNTYTVTREADDGPIYVAMKPVSNEMTISFTATAGTKVYEKSVSGKTLSAGNIYPVGVTVAIQGTLPGVFEIDSSHKKVYFSRGNLLYDNGTWQFHTNQYDRCFTSNDAYNLSQIYESSGRFDLFGWGTSGIQGSATRYQPWETANTDGIEGKYRDDVVSNSMLPANLDWGYNKISNGGNATGLWRTPSEDQWRWILGVDNTPNPGTNCRTSSTVSSVTNARFAKGLVNGVKGIIIFPDVYTQPAAVVITSTSINNKSMTWDDTAINVISADDWSLMEKAGAVFLPVTGYRYGTGLSHIDGNENYTYYWTSKASNQAGWANILYFMHSNVTTNGAARKAGAAVRLVMDAN